MLRKVLAMLALAALPASAEINGAVVNRTTGKPQANASVTLTKMGGGGGLQAAGETKTDANGKFSFDQSLDGPTLIRATWDNVTYSRMLPPGTPSTNLTLDVYHSSKSPGPAKVSKHMILFEPGNGQVTVNETYIYANEGNTAWNDSKDGTLHFYLPPGAASKLQINATAPGGMPIPAPTSKSTQPDVYKTDFAIKPGETRFDLTYSFPYTMGDQFEGKVATKDDNTYLIAPNGITLKAENVKDLGVEPRTQAHIFGLTGTNYNIQLTGTEIATAENSGGDQQEGGPQIQPILPRIYTQVLPIMAIALGILGLGFVLLYRKEAPDRK
jgi:hypothetical protein